MPRAAHLRVWLQLSVLAEIVMLAVTSPAFGQDSVTCIDGQETRTARGYFMTEEPGQGTRLFLTRDAEPVCVIRHEEYGTARISPLADFASFEGVCRDAETNRDHAIVHTSAGRHSVIQIWSVDSATGIPVQLYSEGWGDAVYGPGREWGVDLLVSRAGTCLWRARHEARQSTTAAIAALRTGTVVDAGESWFDLPVRPIRTDAVQRWLPVLQSAARLEGAAYADESGRASWWVVQALGTTLCDADGVVLLLDRQRNTWQSIYDVQSGCSYELNYPLRGIVVAGDRMYASICTGCDSWPRYRDYVIDLRSYRATLVGPDGRTTGPAADENPVVHEADLDTYLQSGH